MRKMKCHYCGIKKPHDEIKANGGKCNECFELVNDPAHKEKMERMAKELKTNQRK